MDLEVERKNWNIDAPKVDKFVDVMMANLITQQDAVPVAYMAIDAVFRPYLKWLHTAQQTQVDPTLTRNSIIHLISIMVLEAAMRMGGKEEDGTKMTLPTWVDDFLDHMVAELDSDIRELMSHQGTA